MKRSKGRPTVCRQRCPEGATRAVDTTSHPSIRQKDETEALPARLNLAQLHKLQRLQVQSLLTIRRLAESSTKLKASIARNDAFGAWQFDAESYTISLLSLTGSLLRTERSSRITVAGSDGVEQFRQDRIATSLVRFSVPRRQRRTPSAQQDQQELRAKSLNYLRLQDNVRNWWYMKAVSGRH